jgi:hypothetical protein
MFDQRRTRRTYHSALSSRLRPAMTVTDGAEDSDGSDAMFKLHILGCSLLYNFGIMRTAFAASGI